MAQAGKRGHSKPHILRSPLWSGMDQCIHPLWAKIAERRRAVEMVGEFLELCSRDARTVG
jgi:hypothetical protein